MTDAWRCESPDQRKRPRGPRALAGGAIDPCAFGAARGPLAPGTVRHDQVTYRGTDLAFWAAPVGDLVDVGDALRVTW
jgi:hypothetical protein